MEEDKTGAGSSSRVLQPHSAANPSIVSPPQAQPPAPAPTKKPAKETPAAGKRQLFTVELRRSETTIVSWKKLLRESGSANGETSALIADNPVPDTRPVGGVGFSRQIMLFICDLLFFCCYLELQFGCVLYICVAEDGR